MRDKKSKIVSKSVDPSYQKYNEGDSEEEDEEKMSFDDFNEPNKPAMKINAADKELTTSGCIFRVTLVVVTIMMAITIPHFSILMGFIGNFTGTMLSFIWPSYFHLKIKGGNLSVQVVAWDCFIIFLGFTFAIIGIYDSGVALVEAFSIGLPF